MNKKLSLFIETIQLKHDIKREYFTVAIPVIVAIAIVLIAIMTGHTLDKTQQVIDDRQQAYLDLLEQLGEESEGDTETAPVEAPVQENKADLDHIIIYAALIAMTPYAFDRYLQRKKKRNNEEDYTQFLFKLSEMMRAGIDPIKSVIELSKTDMGSLTPNIRSSASTMLLGGSFEEGMRRMSAALKSEMATKYNELVIQASYMGGAVSDLILKASEDMRSMIMIEREMEGNLKQYTLIFYFAQFIIVILAFILCTTLFPFLSGEGIKMLFGGNGIADINFQRGFFHLIIINAVIGGVIIGKITEGSAKDGIKHCIILVLICYVACVLFVLPVAPGETFTIKIVSGDGQESIGGLPLKEPLVIKVLDSAGKPKSGLLLSINITPSGFIDPVLSKTNDDGIATINIIPGESTGEYIIEIKAGESIKKAMVKVKSE